MSPVAKLTTKTLQTTTYLNFLEGILKENVNVFPVEFIGTLERPETIIFILFDMSLNSTNCK